MRIITLLLTLCLPILTASAKVEIGRMTVEGRDCPLGLDDMHPRFGWQISSDKNNVMQRSYRIIVASSQALCEIGKADVWDSGVTKSSQSQWIEYKGLPLIPGKKYFWRVVCKTNKGTAVSSVKQWTTGLLSSDNWKGDWIGCDSLTPDVSMQRHSRIAARHFRKTFTTGKSVRRATAYVCGLGYYILNIDGQRIGNYLLAPAPTQYDKAAIYDTYDVTENLKNRGNTNHTLEAVVAGGYFFPMTQNFQTNVRSAYGMPKLKLNLIVEYDDGANDTIATDNSWLIAMDGPIRYTNLYDGTLIDYRQKPTQWMPAQVVGAPCDVLRGNSIGGIICYATESARTITPMGKKRTYVLDFGTNNTGRIHLPQALIANGDTVVVRYAETLNDDGSLYTANLRSAENTDYFIGNGEVVDLTTEFLWHGFRYAEVIGLEGKDVRRIMRQLMTDDLVSTASIIIKGNDDGMLNRVLDNARRGILSNYKGIPMDCPQRDERMPWLGDRTMGCFGESYLTNNHTIYTKWLQDICDAQLDNGCISDVCPSYWRLYNGNITWPAALPFGMEMLRLQYGDERPWQAHRDNVIRFLAFAKNKSGKDGLITYDRYGDWCVPPATLDEVLTKDSTRMTDGTLISSCYYYYICKMMGMDDEAEETKTAINARFLNNGCYANGTVTANLLPLALGIVPERDHDAVMQHFVKRVKGDKGEPHIDCGVIGISWLMRYLSKANLGEIAWQIATTKTYPGWGYMAVNGATTIWELWNGNTANPSMNSGNHVMMLGDLIPWVYECLAGIAPDPREPGFKHVIMRPDFSISAMNGVEATYPSIYGDIRSQWQRDNIGIVWNIELPCNTTATIRLPDGSLQKVSSGKHSFTLSSR